MTKIRSTDASRIQDRRGQSRSSSGIPGLGGGGFPMGIGAGGGIIGLIVVAAAMLLPRLLGGASPANLTSTGAEETPAGATESCQTDLEQTVCGATNDVQDFWARTFPTAFGGREYEFTETVFFSGYTNTGCGQASSETGPFYCPLDNLVYFDLDFLVQLQEQFGATGDLAAQYIVAHEYGHHVQNLLGINSQMQRLQQQNPDRANEYSVALELQADCLAGAWVHDAAGREGNLIEQGEIDEALNAAAAVGDDRIQQQTQGRVDPESFTHGTSQQRVDWFKRGYSTGDPNECDTFNEVL